MDDPYAAVCEQSLSRLSSKFGRDVIMPLAFQYIPNMLVSDGWKMRDAGLVAISAVMKTPKGTLLFSLQTGLETEASMDNELGQIIECV